MGHQIEDPLIPLPVFTEFISLPFMDMVTITDSLGELHKKFSVEIQSRARLA